MGRSAILLVLIGLVVGLWLGFNPTTHRELVRWWNHTTTSQVRSTATQTGTISLRQLDRRINRWFRTEARPQRQGTPPAAASPVPTGNEIAATLQAFWRALEQVWVRFLLNLGIKHI
jgi:hypothetical protein